ncbi:MAG: hypothetical protein H6736_17155 [Alphaproteobacteria bacterium]|nr:hypothetical protein [Alphaproteobacteria bacterium]
MRFTPRSFVAVHGGRRFTVEQVSDTSWGATAAELDEDGFILLGSFADRERAEAACRKYMTEHGPTLAVVEVDQDVELEESDDPKARVTPGTLKAWRRNKLAAWTAANASARPTTPELLDVLEVPLTRRATASADIADIMEELGYRLHRMSGRWFRPTPTAEQAAAAPTGAA